MKAQPMIRRGDCLATAAAAMLNIDAVDLPHTGVEDYELAWRLLRTALWERGWRISYVEWPTEGQLLSDILSLDAPASLSFDTIDASMLWLVSVTHPSYVMDGRQVNHVLVIRGGDVVFYPEPVNAGPRPPIDELVMRGSFMLSPTDPGRFTLQEAS